MSLVLALLIWVYWIVLLNSSCLLYCEKLDRFLACFGFWVMDWKVKSETASLRFDLAVCSLEKVTPIKKSLIRQSHVYWTWIESKIFKKLWLIRFRHFISPWKSVMKLQLSVLKRLLDDKVLDWQFGFSVC